jgi:hypothetical protein
MWIFLLTITSKRMPVHVGRAFPAMQSGQVCTLMSVYFRGITRVTYIHAHYTPSRYIMGQGQLYLHPLVSRSCQQNASRHVLQSPP